MSTGEYPSLWAAVESIAPKIGCALHTLLEWIRFEVDSPEGITTSAAQRVKAVSVLAEMSVFVSNAMMLLIRFDTDKGFSFDIDHAPPNAHRQMRRK